MQMLKSKRVRRALEAVGYDLRRITASEFHYVAPNGTPITLTLGHNEISSASVKRALRQGSVTWEAFWERY